MHKVALRRKPQSRRHHRNDLDKIKALILKAAPDWKHNLALEGIKEKSAEVQHYLAGRPVKSIGFSLLAGLCAGFFVGYYLNNK